MRSCKQPVRDINDSELKLSVSIFECVNKFDLSITVYACKRHYIE